MPGSPRLERLLAAIIARRWLVILFWLALLPPAVWLALQLLQAFAEALERPSAHGLLLVLAPGAAGWRPAAES